MSDLNVADMEKAMDKEVVNRWELPLTIELIRHVKEAGDVPLGVSKQLSINEKGENYTKIHVKHACSLPGTSGLWLNNWVLKDTLHPRFYGFCIIRILHMIAAIRLKDLSKCILIEITDLDDAYLRIYENTRITSTCIKILVILAFLCLHLNFGTTSVP